MQNGLKELITQSGSPVTGIGTMCLPDEVPQVMKYLVKVPRHHTCPVKQDIIEAPSETAALGEFARRHKADVSSASVRPAQVSDLKREVRGGT